MKFNNTLIVVKDIDRSVDFYKKILGLRVINDFGANKTLTGGICFQTEETWKNFIGSDKIAFGANNSEIYFEEDDFDAFAEKISSIEIKYVHPVKEHPWGQRVVRFYDPDMHIIEVGENIKMVCRRFIENGLTPEETAKRMDVPLAFVVSCIKEKKK